MDTALKTVNARQPKPKPAAKEKGKLRKKKAAKKKGGEAEDIIDEGVLFADSVQVSAKDGYVEEGLEWD